jgi:hypothetical protein
MRLALACVLCLWPAASTADWLVLKSGERIATRGEWKERGRSVVYTTFAEGKLVSIPAAEVDLAASVEASAGEPARKELYADLGAAPDARKVPPQPEINALLDWIQDPTSPRVSGTLSAPGLKPSFERLVAEGRLLNRDPEGVARDLRLESEQIGKALTECLALAKESSEERDVCTAAHTVAVAALREKTTQVAEALAAAREYDRQIQREEEEARRERKEAERESRRAASSKSKTRKSAGDSETSPSEDESESESGPPGSRS